MYAGGDTLNCVALPRCCDDADFVAASHSADDGGNEMGDATLLLSVLRNTTAVYGEWHPIILVDEGGVPTGVPEDSRGLPLSIIGVPLRRENVAGELCRLLPLLLMLLLFTRIGALIFAVLWFVLGGRVSSVALVRSLP